MTWVRAFVLTSAIIVVTLPAQAARQADVATMTVQLISTETYSKVLTDRAPTNEHSKGDVIVVESKLRNAVAQFGRPRGAVVGEATAAFTIRSPTRAHLILELRLPGGELRAVGRVRSVPGRPSPSQAEAEGSRMPAVPGNRSPTWFGRGRETEGSWCITWCGAEPTVGPPSSDIPAHSGT